MLTEQNCFGIFRNWLLGGLSVSLISLSNYRISDQVQLCYTEAMSTLFTDTDPQVEELQIRLLREVPVWRKLEMFVELNASARLLAISGLRQRFPDADQSEIRYRLATLLYGDEFARKTLGG